MAQRFKVALVQNRACADMDANVAECSELVREAHDQGADLICLPEFFSCLASVDGGMEVGAYPEDEHPALRRFSALARELGTWIQPGSIATRLPSGKLRNRALMLDPSGSVVARYDKVHMFDVDLADGESYRESAQFEGGDEAVLAPTPWGLVGMTVCYDLRFAYLYRVLAQAGASYLTVPAAFMRTTGKAHWHVLLRSRAIETGCYVFAPLPVGRARRRRHLRTLPGGRALGRGDRRRRRGWRRGHGGGGSGEGGRGPGHGPGPEARPRAPLAEARQRRARQSLDFEALNYGLGCWASLRSAQHPINAALRARSSPKPAR